MSPELLPPSLAVTPNIPWCDQTLEQLRLERDYWHHKFETSAGFASGNVALGFMRGCEKWIAIRAPEGISRNEHTVESKG